MALESRAQLYTFESYSLKRPVTVYNHWLLLGSEIPMLCANFFHHPLIHLFGVLTTFWQACA